MSNFATYRRRLEKANPSLRKSQGKMTISVSVFVAQLEKAYDAGALDRAHVAKQLEEIGKGGETDFGGLFDSILGGSKYGYRSHSS